MKLSPDRRGSAALEFALVFPAVLLFLVGMIAVYTLIASKRAMDYGIEKGLRYAITHGGSGTAPVVNAYNVAAGVVWRTVGASSSVTVTPAAYKAGDTVTISVTFAWAPPAGLLAPYNNSVFAPVTLSANGSARVMN